MYLKHFNLEYYAATFNQDKHAYTLTETIPGRPSPVAVTVKL